MGPERSRDQVPVSGASSLVVLPFVVTGDSAAAEQGRALGHLVAAGLDGLEEIRSVPLVAPSGASSPPANSRAAAGLAARSGARFYVTGVLLRSEGRLRATASLRDRGNADQQVAQAQAEAEDGRLFDLADALVAGLVSSRDGSPTDRLARAAAGSTRSLVALKAYLEGERLLRSDRYGSALDAFRRAVRADTAFALAYYRLSVAAELDGDADQALWAADLAVRFGERLLEHERRLLEAYLVHRHGRIDEAERRYRRILADYPGDEEAWFQLAEVLFHLNPLRGRSIRAARPALERLLALEPGKVEGLLHLARIASLEDDASAADSLVRMALDGLRSIGALNTSAFRTFASNHPRAGFPIRGLATDTAAALVRAAVEAAVTWKPRSARSASPDCWPPIPAPVSCARWGGGCWPRPHSRADSTV